MSYPPCPECSGTEFFHFLDSLAFACKGCGVIWMWEGPNAWGERCGTVKQWAADHYEASLARDERVRSLALAAGAGD